LRVRKKTALIVSRPGEVTVKMFRYIPSAVVLILHPVAAYRASCTLPEQSAASGFSLPHP
jgi:hypothetical protein